MGQKQSTFSKFDDLVVDHHDVWAKLKQVFGALGSKGSSCTLPLTENFSLPSPKARPISRCSSCNSLAIALDAATEAVRVQSPCSRNCDDTIKAVRSTLAVATEEAAAAVNSGPEAAAAAVSVTAYPKTVSARPSTVQPLPDLIRQSTLSAAVRVEVEQVFTNVDWAQQQQDKAEALGELAANSNSKAQLTEQEKEALQDAGRQARLAEAAGLAVQLDATDAALRAMSTTEREQWFERHAKQQQTDATEMDFEDEWAHLPPDVLALVAEMQSN